MADPLYALQGGYVVLKSVDDGETWAYHTTWVSTGWGLSWNSAGPFLSVAGDDDIFVVAGHYGGIKRWHNSAWSTAKDPSASSLKSLWVFGDFGGTISDGWAVDGRIWRWNAGTQKFSDIFFSQAGVTVTSIWGWDAQHVYFGGTYSGPTGFIKRFDGFTLSNVAGIPACSGVQQITGWGPDNFLFVDSGKRAYSWNGATWTTLEYSEAVSFKHVAGVDDTHFSPKIDGDGVHYYNAGSWGYQWTTQRYGGYGLSKVSRSDTSAFHAGEDASTEPTSYKSTNGLSWTLKRSGITLGWGPLWAHSIINPGVIIIPTPTIENKDPADGAVNVPQDKDIEFSFEDAVTTVDLTTALVYVDGVLVYNGATDTFSAGWTGSSYSPSLNGYDFILNADDNFGSLSKKFIRGYVENSYGGVVDETWSFTAEPIFAKRQPIINHLAYDLIRLSLPEPVVVTAALSSLSNYSITTQTEDADDVSIIEVRGVDPKFYTASFVDLHITRATKGAVYLLTVINQRNTIGEVLAGNEGAGLQAYFEGRITKTDSMILGLANMYKTDVDSTLRHIFMSLALEDERIGGQGDLSPIPIKTYTARNTYGTGTFGTSTGG